MNDFQTGLAQTVEQVPDEFHNEERYVPGQGPSDAEVMLVGEAPGATEVSESAPFVGQAGRKLDSALNDIGIDRSGLYLTNVVKVRPPDNKTPTKDEIDAWMPVLEVEIDHVNPAIIVPLGTTASQAVLSTQEGITEVRGREFDREDRTVVPTFHPAAMFYDDSKQVDFEADLEKALAETG